MPDNGIVEVNAHEETKLKHKQNNSMKNIIPKAFDALLSFAEKAADGLHSLGVALGIMHNTETIVRADLTTARTSNNAYQAAKSTRLAATNAQDTADKNAIAFITAARDVLKQTLGSRYSQAWNEVGYISGSLAVPATVDGRLALVKSIELYLTAHPAHEIVPLITHQKAATVYDALNDAISALNTAWSDQREKKNARDAAAVALQERLRNLSRELMQFLSDTDPRWLEFGFNVPADDETPDVPEDLVVLPGSSGHLVAHWPASARADRYRLFKQVVNVDQDFVYVDTITDTSKDMNTFTPGAHVKVRVTAVNEAGESLPSDPVEQVVP
jgi:hypothetical protein